MNDNELFNDLNTGNTNEQTGSDNDTMNKKTKKKNKVKSKKAGKVAGAIALAAVFGVCTGAGIYGAQNFTSLSLSDDASS